MPIGQASQCSLCSFGAIVPTRHDVHAGPAPATLENVPRGHGRQTDAAVAARVAPNVPTGHLMQSLSVALTLSPQVPAGHGWHCGDVGTDQKPATQPTHSCWPSAAWNVPVAQTSHGVGRATVTDAEPTAHGEQTPAPPRL